MKLRLIAVHSIFAIISIFVCKLLDPKNVSSFLDQAYREHPYKWGILVVVRDPVWG